MSFKQLEVVEVDHQQRSWRTGHAVELDHALEERIERATVVHAGQRVGLRGASRPLPRRTVSCTQLGAERRELLALRRFSRVPSNVRQVGRDRQHFATQLLER